MDRKQAARVSAALVIICLVAVVFLAGCVGQQPQEKPQLFTLTKDGVEYTFSGNIYDEATIPMYDKDVIFDKVMLANRVWILFTNDSVENQYVATASVGVASKLTHYYGYSQARFVKVSGIETSNMTNVSATDMLIEFRGPNTGATGTDVHVEGDRIIVQALNMTGLPYVGDRLTMILFENELRALNIVLV